MSKPSATSPIKAKDYVVLKGNKDLGRKGQIVSLTEEAAKAHKDLVRSATRNDLAIAGRTTSRAK